ncbi:MAG TPA: HlyD family efflux transporter periplasmic adaptor subunit [Candidatus Competibacter sp.]|nr:HlyD family efflux transporter periplasmic adaptor subunit [Candidatus Competibacter sp.]
MNAENPSWRSLTIALADHGVEGAAILAAEPSPLIRALLFTMAALLLAGLAWSFVGRADVVVTATGTLQPEEEVRRVYAPVDGELVNLYVSEGTPVAKGDVLARIDARGAVEAEANALKADLDLTSAERNQRLFPARKQIMVIELENLKSKLEMERKSYERSQLGDKARLIEDLKNQIDKTQARLDKARIALEAAEKEPDRYERLYAMPDHGGISRKQLEEAQSKRDSAKAEYQLTEAELTELALKLDEQIKKGGDELISRRQKLMELEAQYQTKEEDIKNEEYKVEMELRKAKLAAESAARVNFKDFDEENFLRILAPSGGIVTEVQFTQTGDKIQANKPLLGIAPEGTRSVLQLEIDERDRAFLKEGQEVQIKFTAFPYQNHGFIKGILEYVAPATVATSSAQEKKSVYKGRVGLEKDYFVVDGMKHTLRYGMTAMAEIVVRKRRLIDMALDPIRNISIQ